MRDMRLRMRRRARQVLAWVVGLTALGVVVAVAVSNGRSEPDVDRESYEKGYHSLRGDDVWLPPAEDDRSVTEEYCALLWGDFPSRELHGVVKEDWIDGCADFREGRESRFASE